MLALNALGEGDGELVTPMFVGSAVVGVAALVAFMRHIRRSAQPFIPPRFITGRGFGAVNVVNVVYGGVVAGLIALVPLYATTRYGISALGSGTLLTAQGAAVIILSTLAAFGLRRTGYRWPILVGAVIMAIGVFGLSLSPQGISAYAWLALSACVVGVGAGVSSPASRNAGLQLAPDRSSSLAALRSMGRQVGSITAISVMTAVISLARDPGVAQARLYVVGAVLLLVVTPVIARIQEHRGAW